MINDDGSEWNKRNMAYLRIYVSCAYILYSPLYNNNSKYEEDGIYRYNVLSSKYRTLVLSAAHVSTIRD